MRKIPIKNWGKQNSFSLFGGHELVVVIRLVPMGRALHFRNGIQRCLWPLVLHFMINRAVA